MRELKATSPAGLDRGVRMDFLKSVTAKEALETISSVQVSPEVEAVDLHESLDRVLARDITSREPIPPFPRSLVDGYAVRAKDTYGGKETSPSYLTVNGEVRVGEGTSLELRDGESAVVSTGAMIPAGADAAVMEEYVRRLPDGIEVTRSVHKGENVIHQGEDIRKGDLVLEKGKRLSPFDLGVLAALGCSKVPVFKKPVVCIISSGDEIVDVDQEPPVGRVRDINRYTVSNILVKEDAIVRFCGIARDTIDEITEKLLLARDCDLILVSGGSSKGERDFITASIERLGGIIIFHGINVKPGKPTIFGRLWGKPVFGLPGHPTSCIMVVIRFVVPLVRTLKGESSLPEAWGRCELTSNIPSSLGIEEYVRVTVEKGNETCYATPVFAKSSVISSLARADGYIVVPEGREGYEAGEKVEVHLF
jgi:molybdopterin molybdotransferase